MAPAKRELTCWLADPERRLLRAVATRLPAAVHSDHLTALGILGAVGVGAAYALSRCNAEWLWVASACLVVQWLGDSLDGTLARVRDQQRPRYGYYVDHVIDLAGAAALFAGIAASGLMQMWIALALAAAFFLVSAESYLATHARGLFRLSFAGLGPTELRLVLAAGAVAAVHKPWVTMFGVHARLFDIGGLVAAVGMVVAFAVAAVTNTRALYLAEPLKTRHQAGLSDPSTSTAGPVTRHAAAASACLPASGPSGRAL